MAFDDSGDKTKRNAAILIHTSDSETDCIQSAGHVDGAVELGLGVDAGLKTHEKDTIFHAGNNTKVVGVGHDFL